MTINDIVERYPTDIREHAERVADMVKPFGEDYVITALLHDIIEDTNTEIDELINSLHIEFDIIDSIFVLTRFVTETYFEYIDRIISKGGKRAIIIKYYDILDHLHNKTTLKPTLEKRYLKAKKILEEVI